MYVLAEKRAAVFIIYGKNVKEISCRKRKKSKEYKAPWSRFDSVIIRECVLLAWLSIHFVLLGGIQKVPDLLEVGLGYQRGYVMFTHLC